VGVPQASKGQLVVWIIGRLVVTYRVKGATLFDHQPSSKGRARPMAADSRQRTSSWGETMSTNRGGPDHRARMMDSIAAGEVMGVLRVSYIEPGGPGTN